MSLASVLTRLRRGDNLTWMNKLGGLSGLIADAAASVASAARTLAGNEANALAIDFTDDSFQATTGFYGSAYIVDTGTPANDYDSSPDGLEVYDAIPFDDTPPTYGAEVTTEQVVLRSAAFGAIDEMSVIVTLTDGGTAFKTGVAVPSGSIAWDGTVGASVPGGLSGACIVTDVLIVPRAMTDAELEAATT